MTRKTVIIITSGILVTEIVWQLYKRFRKKTLNTSNGCVKRICNNTEAEVKIFEVMFFSSDSALCRSHIENRKLCAKANCAVVYLRRIIDYLNSATETVDICMYFFTCQNLAKAIADAHKRGVAVRIIIDETMAQNDGSQTMCFYKEGVKLRLKQLDVLMHHKFAIIDNNILISGSLNWTMTAFFGNFDNIMVTNEAALVKPFVNEFERIWTVLDITAAEDDFGKCRFSKTYTYI